MKIKVSTRVVFLLKNIVIKIPISYRGYLQCKNEKFIWDKYKHTGMLAELHSERFGIIVMKKYPSANRVPEYVVHGIKSEISEFDIFGSYFDSYAHARWRLAGLFRNI